MESFEQRFSALIEVLKKNAAIPIVWNEAMVNALHNAMMEAGFEQTGGAKKKKLNGYNLYMRERMLQLKDSQVDSNTRMKQISDEWKKLLPEQKDSWKVKADALQPVKIQIKLKGGAQKERKPAKLSGYQVYVSEKMSTLDVKMPPKDRMTEIGKMWKALGQPEKDAFKAKAEVKNVEKASA
jgi:hypothetical protein